MKNQLTYVAFLQKIAQVKGDVPLIPSIKNPHVHKDNTIVFQLSENLLTIKQTQNQCGEFSVNNLFNHREGLLFAGHDALLFVRQPDGLRPISDVVVRHGEVSLILGEGEISE